jgi:hypothetical protein
MRAAARALALDPENREPADLVGRLMLEPPREVPAEVGQALVRLDNDALFAARPWIASSSLVFVAMLPVMWLAGLRGAWYLIAGSTCSLAMAGLAWQTKRPTSQRMGRAVVACWAVLVALLSIVTTPFLLAPGVAAVAGMSMGSHPQIGHPKVLIGVMVGAVLGPWLFTLAGVGPQNVSVVGNSVVLTARADELVPGATLVGLVVYAVGLIAVAILLARALVNDRRSLQRAVELQSWQLRQLVPRAPGA